MRLTRLEVGRLPGIRPGFSLELPGADAVFITGPNASGKTSLVRALRLLLREPAADDPLGVSLDAEFRDADTRWSVRRDGAQVEWRRDGQPARPPPLPGRDALAGYLVTVEDLLRVQGDNERHLAEALRRELDGGYDLAALRRGEFELQPRVGQSEQRRLEQARDELRRIEAEQRRVREQELALPELAGRIARAGQSAREVERLALALDLLDRRRELDAARQRLQAFPDDMQRLEGSELRRLDEIDEQLQALRSRRDEVTRARDRAQAGLAEYGHRDESPAQAECAAAEQRLAALARLEDRRDLAREALGEAEVRLRTARARLGRDHEITERLPRLGTEAVDRARDLARRFELAEQTREHLTGLIRATATAPEEHDAETLKAATSLLREWLSAGQTGLPDAAGLAIALTGLAGAGGAAIGAVAGPTWLALAGATLALLPSVVLLGQHLQGQRRRSALGTRYRARQLPPPQRWSGVEVRELLDRLEAARARQRHAEARAEQTAVWHQRRRRIERELVALEKKRRALAEKLGFDPARTRNLDDFIARATEYQQAETAVLQARATLADIERRIEALGEACDAFIRRWSRAAPGPDHAARAAAVAAIRQAAANATEARGALADAERELQQLDTRLTEQAGRRRTLFEQAGLVDGKRTTLERRLQQLPAWRDLERQIDRLEALVRDRRERLAGHETLIELAETGRADELAARHAAAEGDARELDALRAEQARIEERVRQTGRERERERALADERDAARALARIRADVVGAATAHALLDDIEEDYRRDEEPIILREAREAFAEFTHHQWQLELDDQHGFGARDTALARRRRLTELSTATRMQLLLALRLAQVAARERQQHQAALPLVVDDALATSDPQRAGVILQTLARIMARGDRQLLYLSADAWAWQLWQDATDLPAGRIDLEEVRHARPTDDAPGIRIPPPPEVPSPHGRSAAEYAAILGVAAPDAFAEPGATHLFHLLYDELDTLYVLLRDFRIRTAGQLENLLESRLGRDAIDDAGQRARLEKRLQVLDAWLRARRIGRGRRLDRATLHAARDGGGLSDNTIDGVVAAAEAVDFDPAALVERLRAEPIAMSSGTNRRIARPQLEALEAFLLESGHLDAREPLDAGGRRARVIERLAGAGDAAAVHAYIDYLESIGTKLA